LGMLGGEKVGDKLRFHGRDKSKWFRLGVRNMLAEQRFRPITGLSGSDRPAGKFSPFHKNAGQFLLIFEVVLEDRISYMNRDMVDRSHGIGNPLYLLVR